MNIDDRMANDPGTELAANLDDPNAAGLSALLTPHAQQLVQTVDPLEVSGQGKHDWVYNSLLELVPLLQSAVKETRVIPADVIATVVAKVIEDAVSWRRGVL